jgi:hypothetical protein
MEMKITGKRKLKDNRCKLFGGDAARQRAELFLSQHGWGYVFILGDPNAPFSAYGLDQWGRAKDGVIYSHVAVVTAER